MKRVKSTCACGKVGRFIHGRAECSVCYWQMNRVPNFEQREAGNARTRAWYQKKKAAGQLKSSVYVKKTLPMGFE